MKIKLFFTSLFLLFFAGGILAQNIEVRGVVTDAANGEPIPYAYLKIVGTNSGVSSNDIGEYRISAPGTAVLEVTSIGYSTLQVAVNGRSKIDIALSPSTVNLDEVMVVAYGTAKKESFTGSAQVVKSDKIIKRSVSNVSKAIEGLVSGVTTTSGSGQPGSGASIQIRGYGSINASSTPLYVVDGIPFDGTLSSLNANDIESMTILKDASAGALYGARGANGVIIINTKRGTEGHINVNLKAQVGMLSRSIPRYDMVNQKEFTELTYESLYNRAIDSDYTDEAAKSYASSGLSGALGGSLYNPFKKYTWDTVIDKSTGKVQSDAVSAWDDDWMDELTNKNALRSEYQLGINGGNNKTKYNLSVGYLNEEGVLITTEFSRYSVRAGVEHKAAKWFEVGANTSYSYTDANQSQYSDSQTGNAWYTAQFMAPIYPVYLKDENGNNLLDENGKKQYDYGETGRPKAAKFNAVGDMYDNKYGTTYDNVSYRTFAKLGGDDECMGIFKGLSFTMNFGGDLANRNISSYYNPYHGDGASTSGSINKYNTRTFSYTFNQLLTYDKKIDKHHINILAGHEYYSYSYKYLYAERTNVYPGIEELAPSVNVTDNNSYSYEYNVESFLTRLNYDYADKYYISGSWRTDGSSRFYKDKRWGNFWSVGASWRISQENWMKNIKWINNLTLKASYGKQGNDNLLNSSGSSTYYAWQSFYDLTYPNATLPGAIVTSLENRNVTWEKKGTYNIGIEATLFNRLLNLSVEYYNSKTDDMLLSFPMPMSTGFTGYNANVGSMKNTGIEGSITANWINKNKFRASSTLSISHNKNKVMKLTDTDVITSGVRVIEVGKPIYTYYITKAAGVDPETGNQLYWAYKKDDDGNKIDGSDYITSNTTEATASKYYLGSREPKFYGSFSSDFQIGSFDVSFLTTFSVGGKVYNSVYSSSMEVTYSGDTWNKDILKRWQKPGDETDVPKVLIGSSRISSIDKWLVNASYFTIKSIQVGYTLPERWTKKISMKSVRLFAIADNIYMFNHMNGLDPQYSFIGGQNWSYTPTRTISLGLDINF